MTTPDILCIGSVLWDIIGRTRGALRSRGDVAGQITRLPGGVAMNIAMTLARFGMRPAVLTAIGRDAEGRELIEAVRHLGVIPDFALRTDRPTDRYMAIEDAGGLVAAIADAHTLEACDDAILAPLTDGRLGRPGAPWRGPIALDGNLTADLLGRIAGAPAFDGADLRVAPASPGKAERLLPLLAHPGTVLYVNRQEASLLTGRDHSDSRAAAEALVAAGAPRALVTDGARDASDARLDAPTLTVAAHPVQARRVTGAGDTFMAAHLFAETRGATRPEALTRAQAAAAAYVAQDEGTP
ncbi:MAG: kinase [Rhodobacter sp.]|uniref:PfkB family carbohydrate kinase n=1 Tax=Pararhodobacter sp. TaxID=2127056 RepID=UPI001DD17837|nr:PfkB family carbohydrate kinase [Pararhodobacter sp.]MCB1344202.1 kinase [Paracoccaceae bacterium]MCC0074091.1 kinase [Rhodobacter sp.]HPD93314.1 PfkB family carbohydrate kinase [Pararhodobacter sp.]